MRCHLIANCPLPAHLQVWLPAAQPHLGNHGNSLLDNPSDYSWGSPGDSLSMEVSVDTTVAVEETCIVSVLTVTDQAVYLTFTLAQLAQKFSSAPIS